MSETQAVLAVIAIVVAAFLFGYLADTITQDPVAQRIIECRAFTGETSENNCLEMIFGMKETAE